MNKHYLIMNKRHIGIVGDSTKSRYSVSYSDHAPIKRKLASRSAAREYKSALPNPRNWAIVDERNMEVVR